MRWMCSSCSKVVVNRGCSADVCCCHYLCEYRINEAELGMPLVMVLALWMSWQRWMSMSIWVYSFGFFWFILVVWSLCLEPVV